MAPTGTRVSLLLFSIVLLVQIKWLIAAEIIHYELDGNDTGYNFEFETSNGIARSEKGQFRSAADPDGVNDDNTLRVEGAYTWLDNKGKTHLVRYIADKNGYRTLRNSK